MPNSLKAKLSNLRYKGQITDAEYKELISKLNGHDRQILDEIKAEIIDEAEFAYADFDRYKEEVLGVESDELPDDDFRYGLERAFEIINRKVKER